MATETVDRIEVTLACGHRKLLHPASSVFDSPEEGSLCAICDLVERVVEVGDPVEQKIRRQDPWRCPFGCPDPKFVTPDDDEGLVHVCNRVVGRPRTLRVSPTC